MRLLLAVLAPTFPIVAASDFFEMRVRPVLARNCFACHTKTRMGGLDLSSRASLLQGGKSGPAITPGDPVSSLLLKAVRHELPRLKMPPNGSKLSDAETADLASWIRDGAPWPVTATAAETTKATLWSLQPVRAPSKKGVDNFTPAPQTTADKRTLLRRVTYGLTGLPPTPEEMDAFLADRSPNAYAKVVDRLLASPHYGEKWGRNWLDVARYSDDKLNSERDEPWPQAFRYRDWVVSAFNRDMPYDLFVKAHIAADHLNDPDLLPALGMYGLSPDFEDDRVDVTTRGFLALTVACAQCHDHKFDPIPTKDFYALQGIFHNTTLKEYPLADKETVEAWDRAKKELDDREKLLRDYVKSQAETLAVIFANRAGEYLEAARGKRSAEGLDAEHLERWKAYLARKTLDHPYLNASTHPADFRKLLLETYKEKKAVDEKNLITLGPNPEREDLAQANLASLPRDKYVLWRDFFGDNGVLYYKEAKLERFLAGEWKRHYDDLRLRIEESKKALPKRYPFLHGVADKDPAKIQDMRIHIRGNPQNLGDIAPRAFLSALGGARFSKGSGRLELAEAIASRQNPLTARVMVNRVWQGHFGEGIVKSPSNFGHLGNKPSNLELLDYLAWTFVENGWSIKQLHREIVLSQFYRSGVDRHRRLSAEELRDSLLAVAGSLDRTLGGEPLPFDEKNKRRTLYGFVSRRRLDPALSLFDFPNPNQTSEQRIPTDVPLQRLFLLNSPLVLQACDDLAKRLDSESDRISAAYRLLFQRQPSREERRLAEAFFASKGTWPEYLQVLFATREFLYVN